MTRFKSYPDKPFDLPEGGKVTGHAVAYFRGDGEVGVRTDAHVNDHLPAITYRDRDWLIHLLYRRQADGSFVLSDLAPHISDRNTLSHRDTCPPTFREAIVNGIAEHLPQVWTPELEREGLEADVAQYLHRMEEDEAKLAADLKAMRANIRKQKRRLS